MKAKRSIFNIVFGLLSQLISMGLGLVIPRLFLLNYGSENNGLVSSITQIIVYMSLFEAGVGAASLQALYKPIVKNDKQGISSILSATSIYYKRTGYYYFIAVILLALIYPAIVESSLNKLTVIVVVLFTGIPGAINYYFQGKYRIFLSAEGKDYINASILTGVNILNNIFKIVLLLNGFDIVAVQASYLATTFIQIVIYQIYFKNNYQWINLKV
ncbi:sugar isomerase, partial [Gottfriedia sp. NPDC056225]